MRKAGQEMVANFVTNVRIGFTLVPKLLFGNAVGERRFDNTVIHAESTSATYRLTRAFVSRNYVVIYSSRRILITVSDRDSPSMANSIQSAGGGSVGGGKCMIIPAASKRRWYSASRRANSCGSISSIG